MVPLTLPQRDGHVLVPHLVGPPEERRESARAGVKRAREQVRAQQQKERERGRGVRLGDAVRPVELSGGLGDAPAERVWGAEGLGGLGEGAKISSSH